MCREIAELHPAKVVYGPGTFINTARRARSTAELMRRARGSAGPGAAGRRGRARRLSKRRGDPPAEQERLAAAAASAVQAKFIADALKLALRYGITGPPRINDPTFVSTLVFDTQHRRVGHAEVALRLPVPVEERGADPDPAAPRPDAMPSAARAIELIRTATGERVVQAAQAARATS